MSNADKPAYPIHGGNTGDDPRNKILSGGLTKREYFAAMAMQGLVNREGWAERFNNENGDSSLMDTLAIASVRMADELLKQLES